MGVHGPGRGIAGAASQPKDFVLTEDAHERVRAGGPRAGRAPLDPRRVLTSIGEIVYDWDIATDDLDWSANAGEVLGLPDMAPFATGAAFGLACEDAGGRTRHDAVLDTTGEDAAGSGIAYSARYALRLPGADEPVLVEDTGRWYADEEGRPAFAHGVMRIVRAQASRAAPTPRAGFLESLRADVIEAGRAKRPMTLIVAALDHLESIDAEHGAEIAEAALAEAQRRIATVMRRRDRYALYASNRMAVALLSCAPDQAQIAVERLRSAIADQSFETQRGAIRLDVAFGAASAPLHATDAPALLRRAEEALAASRRAGSAYVVYRPGLDRSGESDPSRRELDIVAALNERRLVAVRQPIVSAADRTPVYGEALARIRGADGRLIGATDIVPRIERAGLVPLLDARMLEIAVAHLAANPAERLAINVSPRTLASGDWLPTISAMLAAHAGVAERLVVEVTETVAVDDPEAARRRLDAMKALGVAIALDDFGAGHTSFRLLRAFPVDILKIDGVFVQNLARSPDDRFFVRTLVDLAHHLGIATVAEWVEDEASAAMLASWGVDYLQGDLFGRPEPLVSAGAEGRSQVA